MKAEVNLDEKFGGLGLALLDAADRQFKTDIVTALREPQRRLVTVLHNRAEQMRDPQFHLKEWARESAESGW